MKLLAVLPLIASPAFAEIPEIDAARAAETGGGWRFDVTLSHPDTGWDHYADAWRVELADGTVLGTRELTHPHVTEQPFTRSLGGVTIPESVTEVHIRARCVVDGWGGQTLAVPLE